MTGNFRKSYLSYDSILYLKSQVKYGTSNTMELYYMTE